MCVCGECECVGDSYSLSYIMYLRSKTRLIYFSLIIGGIALIRSKRRTFLKKAGITLLGAVTASSGTLLYTGHIEPSWIEVTSITLHLPRLQRAFAGYRIVQLSDIHVDTAWMDKGRLEAIVALANEQKPDLIVITGDFVTHVLKNTRDVLSALQALKAHDGVFGVLGNHDHWSDPLAVRHY